MKPKVQSSSIRIKKKIINESVNLPSFSGELEEIPKQENFKPFKIQDKMELVSSISEESSELITREYKAMMKEFKELQVKNIF